MPKVHCFIREERINEPACIKIGTLWAQELIGGGYVDLYIKPDTLAG